MHEPKNVERRATAGRCVPWFGPPASASPASAPADLDCSLVPRIPLEGEVRLDPPRREIDRIEAVAARLEGIERRLDAIDRAPAERAAEVDRQLDAIRERIGLTLINPPRASAADKEETVVPKTRAKFTCHEVAKRSYGNGQAVFAAKFQPVYGDTPENKEFFAATPSGSIEISTIRSDFFEVGKDYFVDFTPAS